MCAHGGTSDPLFRCLNRLIKANVLGTTLLVTGIHVICLLANEMSIRALLGLKKAMFWAIKPESLRLSKRQHLADFFSGGAKMELCMTQKGAYE